MKFLFWLIFLFTVSFLAFKQFDGYSRISEFIFSKPAIAPKFCYYYGETLRLASKNKVALGYFEIVVSTYPGSQYAPGSLLAMADIYDEENQKNKASELYKEFLRLYPENEKAFRVQKKLDLLSR